MARRWNAPRTPLRAAPCDAEAARRIARPMRFAPEPARSVPRTPSGTPRTSAAPPPTIATGPKRVPEALASAPPTRCCPPERSAGKRMATAMWRRRAPVRVPRVRATALRPRRWFAGPLRFPATSPKPAREAVVIAPRMPSMPRGRSAGARRGPAMFGRSAMAPASNAPQTAFRAAAVSVESVAFAESAPGAPAAAPAAPRQPRLLQGPSVSVLPESARPTPATALAVARCHGLSARPGNAAFLGMGAAPRVVGAPVLSSNERLLRV